MPTLAEQMAADALEAMKLSRKFFVVELDYSVASLDKFEDMFAQWHFAMPGGNKPENIDKLVRVWGAYVGEVMRRAIGGEWISEPAAQDARIVLHGPMSTVNAHDIIRRRLTGESSQSLAETVRM